MRSAGRIRAIVLLGALTAAASVTGCTDPEPDRVIVDDGSIPPEVTATTAPPTTEAPTTATSLGPPTLDDSSAVSTAGLGPVEFGMTVAEAERAAGSRLVPTEGSADAPCWTGAFEEGPLGLTLLVADGEVRRLDVTDGVLATVSGAGIGDTADQLRELFGANLEDAPDPDGSGAALIYVPSDESDAGTRIIFTVEDGTVTALRAGQLPEVATGC